MTKLTLRVLGAFQADLDGVPVDGFSSAKARALLAYLIVERKQPHGREALAGLLWPDEPQEVAQANLRQALANLRQVLGERTSASPLLTVTRNTIQVSAGAECEVDAHEFFRLVDACRGHDHRRIAVCDACTARLETARGLYRGDFLAELYVNESPEFEEWALVQRERLREQRLDVLGILAEHYLLKGDLDAARLAASQQLEADPWREAAHRQLMRAHARAGNRSAALAQYETCRRALGAEFGAEPSAETQMLYEAICRGEPAAIDAPPLLNWPAAVTAFVGRQAELAALTERLQSSSTRLVTVTGLGGVGKTRLALEAGARLAPGYRRGVGFVQLAGIQGAAAVSHAIAAAIGCAPGAPMDPAAELSRFLRSAEMLLLLDNCERGQGHTEMIDRLLRGCPQVSVLAIALERLDLAGEWVFQLDGLDLTRRDTSDAASGDAQALFVDRMHRAGVSTLLTPADHTAIERICERVGGLPLAIELAAAWTPVLSCAEIEAELTRSLHFLDVQRVGDPQRTLSAILDQAWALLPARERRVFAQLAVFRGGFRRSEAQAILETDDTLGAVGGPVLDASLNLLVSRSLLRLTPAGRYRQHPLLRQLAADRVARDEQLRLTAEQRHTRTYLALLASRTAALKSADQQKVLAELTSERRNFEAAWRRALQTGAFELIAAALDALSTFYDLHSHAHEAVLLFDETTKAVESATAGDGARGRLLGGLLAHSAMHHYRLHELLVTRTLCERSLAVLPQGSDREHALALHGLGNACFWQGDAETAENCYSEALALANRAGDEWRAGCVTYLLGDCASIRGDHGLAMARYDESLVIFRALGDPRMVAVALSNLGDGYRRQALLSESRAMYEESLAIAEAIGHRQLVTNAQNGLGEVAYDEQDFEEAARRFLASLEVSRLIGSHSLANLNLIGLAHVSCRQGDARQARTYLREAIRSLTEHEGWAILPVAVTGVAHVLALGDKQERCRAVSLLAQVLCHDTTWEDYRHRAMRLLMELQASLPEEDVSKAMAAHEPIAGVIRELLAYELPDTAPALGETGCIDWGV